MIFIRLRSISKAIKISYINIKNNNNSSNNNNYNNDYNINIYIIS